MLELVTLQYHSSHSQNESHFSLFVIFYFWQSESVTKLKWFTVWTRQVKPKLQSKAEQGVPPPLVGWGCPLALRPVSGAGAVGAGGVHAAGAAQARLPAHQRAGEDLRDDPVQIVKEGRPLPQDAAP